uniref:Ig-like domain-containing protein n=1 Tax=Erpetoichthys calabaricus TaxID=27687 RepID=A0A8C4X593_ERPCA
NMDSELCAAFISVPNCIGQVTVMVSQSPSNVIVKQNQSVNLKCYQSASYNNMYWYRQQSTTELHLVVFSLFMNNPEYGNNIPKRFTATRSTRENITLEMNNAETSDTGFYLCAVSNTVK